MKLRICTCVQLEPEAWNGKHVSRYGVGVLSADFLAEAPSWDIISGFACTHFGSPEHCVIVHVLSWGYYMSGPFRSSMHGDEAVHTATLCIAAP